MEMARMTACNEHNLCKSLHLFCYLFTDKNADIDTVSVNIGVLVFMPESYLKPELTKTVRFVTIEVDLKYKGVLCYERACSQIIKRAD